MNIVITGAGGVLCSAFSRALAADGHKIALLDLNLEAAEREAEGIRKAGGEAIAVQANVLDKESLKKAHDVVLEKFGPCEVLINGAGGNNPKGTTTSEYFSKEDMLDENARSFFDLDQDGVSFVFNLNFLGTLLTTQAFATDMLETGGCIVNISSIWGQRGASCEVTYSCTKAALIGLTRSLASELAPTHIRVNCIAPGVIKTDMLDALPPEVLPQLAEETPLRRLGTPEDIAHAAAFLASEKADFITGQVLTVDGGFIL